ncbi:MAG: response regulator, partial [Sediminibacterium sp.]
VKNGVQAVQAYEEAIPDIILMDIQMPEMNGYEATQKIRALQTNVHVPIIAITAGNVKGEKEKCLDAGMDDFISKPIVENTLRIAFDKWLTSKKNAAAAAAINHHAVKPKKGFQALRDMVGDDPVTFKEILQLTKKEIGISLGDLEQLVTKKDLPALKKAGHKLKGTALSSGLQDLSATAAKFERLENFDDGIVHTLLQQVSHEVTAALDLIEQNIPV